MTPDSLGQGDRQVRQLLHRAQVCIAAHDPGEHTQAARYRVDVSQRAPLASSDLMAV